jgi:hypothetical protein
MIDTLVSLSLSLSPLSLSLFSFSRVCMHLYFFSLHFGIHLLSTFCESMRVVLRRASEYFARTQSRRPGHVLSLKLSALSIMRTQYALAAPVSVFYTLRCMFWQCIVSLVELHAVYDIFLRDKER